MEGCNVYDDPSPSQVLDSIWAPDSSPSFHASASMVNFEVAQAGDHASQRQLVEHLDGKVETHGGGGGGDDFFHHHHHSDKKRRLMPNQVRFLEKSFEVENKLEPDRKFQLAKELGLQPRQVAIWFQNRRARCKTKVLEKEYDSLKASFDKLKEDYDSLFADNEKLKNEVHQLTQKLAPGENGKKPKPEPCDPISPLHDPASHDVPEATGYKQDDAASSAKSDVFDSDSPLHDPSDVSQDEDESLMRRTLLHFPKIEVESYDDLQPNSCNLGFPVQDQGTWFWQY